MTEKQPVVLVVDAYSAAAQYAAHCARLGYACVHVQSQTAPVELDLRTLRRADFIGNVVHDGDLGRTLLALERYRPVGVLPGTDFGLELADALAAHYGFPGNGTALSHARHKKFDMAETLRKKGIRATRQLLATAPEEILSWRRELQLDVVVLKPNESAGGDCVTVCSSEADIRAAFDKIYQQLNENGFINDCVLAQEYLRGTQYNVNTVSLRGRHHFTDLFTVQTRRYDSAIVIDRDEYPQTLSPRDRQVQEYTLAVLDALEISHGPATQELMLDERGPVLIEIGARLDGLVRHSQLSKLVGYSQVELAVDACLVPDALAARDIRYSPKQTLMIVHLHSHQEGQIERISTDAIQALPSFFELELKVAVGSALKKTRHLFSSPGFVALMHPDRSVVLRDYERIRKLERQLFAVQLR